MIDILFKNQDLKYKEFHQKLIPNIEPDMVIGVRVPILRQIAKEYYGTEKRERFLKTLPHKYYEENNLHAFFIEQIMDFDKCICEINRFLPYVDNWATCDSMRPKCFCKNTEKLILEIEKWLKSPHTYAVRFGIEMLMVYYLDSEFKTEYLKNVALVESSEYYINMMIAWYFATALAKKWEDSFPYIENRKLPEWIHNKTIQKAIESYRISKDKKELLKSLKYKIG